MPVVSLRDLLEAGVHFGHQTRRWNPKMRPYIFTERNGIYILDLQRSLREIETSYNFVRGLTARGGRILFVGTKKQAQEPIQTEAERSGMPYVNQRWLGGMLTNFVTMKSRVSRLVELETMVTSGTMEKRPKKEQLKLKSEMEKLTKNLSGVRDMTELPVALFVVDTKREAIAVAEARRLHIPIIGIVDTNADPDDVDYVIPGNDDAIRAVALMCHVIADAAIDGGGAREGGAGPKAAAATMAEAANATEAVAPAAEPAAASVEPAAEVAAETAPVAEPEAPAAE